MSKKSKKNIDKQKRNSALKIHENPIWPPCFLVSMETKFEKIEFEAFLSILTLQPTCIPKITTKNSILTKIFFSVVDSHNAKVAFLYIMILWNIIRTRTPIQPFAWTLKKKKKYFFKVHTIKEK